MSNSFGPPTTHLGFTPGTASQPVGGGTTGFNFVTATAGAGDANKPAAPPGLAQTPADAQAKSYGQPFATSFATPRFGGAPTGTPTFGGAPTGTPTFGATPTGTGGFGTPASGTTGFAISQPKSTAGNTPASTTSAVPVGLTYGTPIGTSMAHATQPVRLNYQTPTAQPAGLGLGTLSTPASATGFNFSGNQATTTTSALNFNLGGTPATSVPQATGGINFGAPKTNVSGVLSGPTSTASGGLGGLSFASAGIGGTQTPVSSTGFNVAGTTLQTAPNPGSTLVGSTTATSVPGGFSLSGGQTQTSGTGFNLSGTATATPAPAAASGFNLGTPASGTSFAIGTAAPTTAAPAFNLGGTTTAASTPGFNLGKSAATPAPTAPQTSVPQTSLGTATNVTSSTAAASQPGGLNFCQLEESINKWTLELEEQEKAFVNQATQVNAWDRLLIANGEKIVTLNQEVERVKLEQQQLDHELDYVVGQQRELQDCLVPLEKELASVSASDPEREYTYRLSENLDTQLKQMSEDLKEIIEHLNEANRSQDSSDPIVQIGKILNAHMNSLQWLDQRTAVLQTKIQQIDQLHQNFRQEHERSFNLAYN